MGITYIEGVASGPTGEKAEVTLFVDCGAIYSLLPESALRPIGLEPTRQMTFTLADGTRVERQIPRCYLVLPQGEDYTPEILGEPGDQALLGVVTSTPFSRTLHPMRMMLA